MAEEPPAPRWTYIVVDKVSKEVVCECDLERIYTTRKAAEKEAIRDICADIQGESTMSSKYLIKLFCDKKLMKERKFRLKTTWKQVAEEKKDE